MSTRHMDEERWWKRFVGTLTDLPHTGDDPREMTALLAAAGYYEPRTGARRPGWLNPEDSARAAWRLRYAAPPTARRIAREQSP